MASSGFKASHVEAPYFVGCRDTKDYITNNLMLVCRHPFDLDGSHVSPVGFGVNPIFGLEKTPETMSMENKGTTSEQRAICLNCFSPRKYVLSDFSRELVLQLGS